MTAATAEDMNLLQRKAREWALLVVKLHNTPVPPELESGKKALLSTAKTVKETIEKVAGPIDALQPMNQLGVIPIIVGVVAVTGAAAAITKWTYDYNKFMEKIKARNELIASGLTPVQAHNVIARSETSITGNIATIAKYGAMLGGAYVLAKYLKVI